MPTQTMNPIELPRLAYKHEDDDKVFSVLAIFNRKDSEGSEVPYACAEIPEGYITWIPMHSIRFLRWGLDNPRILYEIRWNQSSKVAKHRFTIDVPRCLRTSESGQIVRVHGTTVREVSEVVGVPDRYPLPAEIAARIIREMLDEFSKGADRVGAPMSASLRHSIVWGWVERERAAGSAFTGAPGLEPT